MHVLAVFDTGEGAERVKVEEYGRARWREDKK